MPRARDGAGRDRMAHAVRRLARREASPKRAERPPAHDLAGRLDRLEREIEGLRNRITALFLTVVGVGVTELLGRVAAG